MRRRLRKKITAAVLRHNADQMRADLRHMSFSGQFMFPSEVQAYQDALCNALFGAEGCDDTNRLFKTMANFELERIGV